MACEVCEHCQGTVSHETLHIRDGFSYHEGCHKCYVCSETDLDKAEVFKGVIFCASCAQRIFQGCSTARRTKNYKGRKTRELLNRHRSHRPNTETHKPTGIIEMASLVTPSTSSKSFHDHKDIVSEGLSTDLALQVEDEMFKDKNKKKSVEMGMTTEITQELLMLLKCPVVNEHRVPSKEHKASSKNGTTVFQYKLPCSDLRIAELGASTEIANMALRHKREMPVIIKSQSRIKPLLSQSTEDSESGDTHEWVDSAYSSLQEPLSTHWRDKSFRSILKLPYGLFKHNILNKSSIINELMTAEDKETLTEKIKTLFNEDITEHQKRGLKRLYSTINRNKTPQKLGWLGLVHKMGSDSRTVCKHFIRSQSYRCMRAHIMRTAGPTKSELYTFRKRVKNFISPGFLQSMAFNHKRCAIMMSTACGNSMVGSAKTRLK